MTEIPGSCSGITELDTLFIISMLILTKRLHRFWILDNQYTTRSRYSSSSPGYHPFLFYNSCSYEIYRKHSKEMTLNTWNSSNWEVVYYLFIIYSTRQRLTQWALYRGLSNKYWKKIGVHDENSFFSFSALRVCLQSLASGVLSISRIFCHLKDFFNRWTKVWYLRRTSPLSNNDTWSWLVELGKESSILGNSLFNLDIGTR